MQSPARTRGNAVGFTVADRRERQQVGMGWSQPGAGDGSWGRRKGKKVLCMHCEGQAGDSGAERVRVLDEGGWEIAGASRKNTRLMADPPRSGRGGSTLARSKRNSVDSHLVLATRL